MVNNPIQPGDAIKVAEGDYLYGRGTLTICIRKFVAGGHGPGLITVQGVELGYNGEERGEREVLVRYAGMLRVDL
jgi:hypothetical protein